MNDISNERATIGGNNPPATRAEELAQRYSDFLDLATAALDAAAKTPDVVNDDDTSGKFAELVKHMREIERSLETAFDAEKAPHSIAITQIQGFFKTHMEALEKARKKLSEINKDYSVRKKEEEKKRLEALAQAKREAQEKKQREANDALTTKAAAEQALTEYKRLSDEADQARSSATSEVEQAQAQVAGAEARLARVKLTNSEIAADLARRVVDGNPMPDNEKAAKRAECDANIKAARADLEAARDLLGEARERAKQAKEAARKAEELAAQKQSEVRTADRDVKHADREAERLGKDADKIEKVVEKDDASLGSVRSIHGALATTMKVWKHSVTDVRLLDKEAIWHLISFDAIEVAVGKWGDLQPDDRKQMPGADFWQEIVGVNR
jgi:chromosome segregation ATPase